GELIHVTISTNGIEERWREQLICKTWAHPACSASMFLRATIAVSSARSCPESRILAKVEFIAGKGRNDEDAISVSISGNACFEFDHVSGANQLLFLRQCLEKRRLLWGRDFPQ
ncbi:MAG: hypothetical protein AAF585_27425, partial [Verrucomicrobiota bacterium]